MHDSELRDKLTAAFARGEFVREFQGFDDRPTSASKSRKPRPDFEDLWALPGNRLEGLKGDRAGQFNIRINVQWRICFEWPQDATGPSNVEIVDYH